MVISWKWPPVPTPDQTHGMAITEQINSLVEVQHVLA